jgi:hypothetical protein
VNQLTLDIRSSHVNSGTSIPREELAWPPGPGRVLRHPKLHVAEERGEVTSYGGLAVAAGLARKLGLPQLLDERLQVLKLHLPYTEADHVLAQAYNLYVGGTCLEDLANLQGSEAVRRILGACRLPDPTTAGDFLRRFGQPELDALDEAIDETQDRVWHRRFGRRRQPLAIVDLDSHVREVYGVQKQGADLSYKGTWSYHPLVISLAGTQECLRLINRPGNAPSAEGASEQLQQLLPRLGRRFRRVVVRGDSAFLDHKILDTCADAGQHFAIVMPSYPNVYALADKLPKNAWRCFQPRARRNQPRTRRQRRRRPNLRRRTARRRNKRDLRLRRQWIAEIPYRPARCRHTYRLIIRRQLIEETDKQGNLFDLWRYRLALTNLNDLPADEVLDLTYQRCDQENLIEQLQNGLAGLRMPTGELMSNAAFLRCARLAHNLKSWLAQLVLPRETLRWEWKRFRHAFVYVAATVIHRARQVWVRLAASHRYHKDLVSALTRLQT